MRISPPVADVTASFAFGVTVPMPTCPAAVMRIHSARPKELSFLVTNVISAPNPPTEPPEPRDTIPIDPFKPGMDPERPVTSCPQVKNPNDWFAAAVLFEDRTTSPYPLAPLAPLTMSQRSFVSGVHWNDVLVRPPPNVALPPRTSSKAP